MNKTLLFLKVSYILSSVCLFLFSQIITVIAGMIAESITDIALSRNQNVLVDGSLKDAAWYEDYFEKLRRRSDNYGHGSWLWSRSWSSSSSNRCYLRDGADGRNLQTGATKSGIDRTSCSDIRSQEKPSRSSSESGRAIEVKRRFLSGDLQSRTTTTTTVAAAAAATSTSTSTSTSTATVVKELECFVVDNKNNYKDDVHPDKRD